MLATLLDRLGALESEVADAFERAIALDPRPKYRDAYAAWRNRRGRDQSL
jgi:hypothetical protein